MELMEKKLYFKVCEDYPEYLVIKDGRVYFEPYDEFISPIKIGSVRFVEIWSGSSNQYVKVAEMIARTYLRHNIGDRLKCSSCNWNHYNLNNYEWYQPDKEAKPVKWRAIRDYNTYEVSNDGWVRNIRSLQVLRPTFMDRKLCVRLYNPKTHSTRICAVEKLVYEAFVRTPTKRYVLSHVDYDPYNNRVDNLKYAGYARSYQFKGKAVCEFSPDGDFVKKWDSASAAAKEYNIKADHIRECCNHMRKSAGWKVWRWDGDPLSVYDLLDFPRKHKGERLVRIPGTFAYVSNYGRVIDTRREGHVYIPDPYGRVKITTNDKQIQRKLHQLVAEAFLPNPYGYKRVVFIDGNKKNCKANNLRWAKDKSYKDNSPR